ncbi:MAG: methionine biosynthesis protein MetW [Magnetococcales bacterium]|nr:methionine biosynthesis protein MetW [Magnetococcales bacterium]
MRPRQPEQRVDLEVLASLVTPGSRVLDLGCGDGLLLEMLAQRQGVEGVGVEISLENVRACIDRGVQVFHGDLDQGLSDLGDDSFDFVILSRTIQTVNRPRLVIREMLRVGKKGLVSLPNFGHWHNRLGLALGGRMPKNPLFPFEWYDTPNIHVCTILDFQDLCREMGVRILQMIPLGWAGNRPHGWLKGYFANHPLFLSAAANLLAPMAVFLVDQGDS